MKEEKKMVPKLRFPEFSDAKGWERKVLAPYLVDCSGRVPSDTELPIYSSTREGLKRQDTYFDGRVLQNNNEYGAVPPDCFVYRHMSDDGLFKFNINETGGDIAVSKEYPVFRTKVLNSLFLLAKLNDGLDFKQFAFSQKAGGTRTRLYFSRLGEWQTPLPSPAEQQKIADCLSSLDELIAAQARKVDALKTHKKGLMQQLFPREGETQPRLRFPEFRGAGEWGKDSLGNLCTRIMDGTHFSPQSKDGPRPYLTSKNIKEGRIDLANLSYISEEEHAEIYRKCPVMSGDVLLTKDGANTGNCAINNLDFEFSLLSSVAVLRGNPRKLHQEFLYQSILSDSVQSLITESMSGQAITRITLAKIGGFNISVASLAEQQRIADCLNSLGDLIASQIQQLATLKTHKKGLMQQLFPSAAELAA